MPAFVCNAPPRASSPFPWHHTQVHDRELVALSPVAWWISSTSASSLLLIPGILPVPPHGWCSGVPGPCSGVPGPWSRRNSTTIHRRRMAGGSIEPAQRPPFRPPNSALRTAGTSAPAIRSAGCSPSLFFEEFSNHRTHCFDGFSNEHGTEHLGCP